MTKYICFVYNSLIDKLFLGFENGTIIYGDKTLTSYKTISTGTSLQNIFLDPMTSLLLISNFIYLIKLTNLLLVITFGVLHPHKYIKIKFKLINLI